MKVSRTKLVVSVTTTRRESIAYGGAPRPYRLLFDAADGEHLNGRSKGGPGSSAPKALIDMARDFAMHEFS